jgi:hypothetical protein
MCNWWAIWAPAEMPDTVILSVSILILGDKADSTGEAITNAKVRNNLYMVFIS